MNGCLVPNTRRAMAENQAGKTPCWPVFSDRLRMRRTQKPFNHMCQMSLICNIFSQLIQKSLKILLLLASLVNVVEQ